MLYRITLESSINWDINAVRPRFAFESNNCPPLLNQRVMENKMKKKAFVLFWKWFCSKGQRLPRGFTRDTPRKNVLAITLRLPPPPQTPNPTQPPLFIVSVVSLSCLVLSCGRLVVVLSWFSHPRFRLVLSCLVLSCLVLPCLVLLLLLLLLLFCLVLSCLVLSWNVLSCTALWCVVLSCLCCDVLSCLVLSCLVLSCLVLSCLVLSCLVLSFFALSFCLVFCCLVLSCLVLSCLVLSCLVLSCLVLSCLGLSCLVLSWVVLSCVVLSWYVLSYCLVLSCLVAFCGCLAIVLWLSSGCDVFWWTHLPTNSP